MAPTADPGPVRVWKVDGADQWIARCLDCDWTAHQINPRLLADLGTAHNLSHIPPDQRPTPPPPPPAHGVARCRRAGLEVRWDCHCGLGWTGGITLVRAKMFGHLAQHGFPLPETDPEPEQQQAVTQRSRRAGRLML